MIEFTLSRVVLCMCGITLMAASIGALGIVNDSHESGMSDDLADSVADLLDRFQDSEADEMVLRGHDILPSDSHVLRVSDGVVTVEHDDRVSKAATSFDGSFDLTRGSEVVLMKSLTECLGDVTDCVGEDVHLLDGVVDVRGGPGTPVDTARHVERMSAVHPGADHDAGHAVEHHADVVRPETVYVEREDASPEGRLLGTDHVEPTDIL